LRSAVKTIQEALISSNIQAGEIAAIGLSGQMHGTVCVGEDGHPLRPAILWADQRSREQVDWLNENLGTELLGRWTGNPVSTGFMLPTWLWIREHEPETARTTTRLYLPKDYLRYCLTGASGTEPSDACSTLLFDTSRRVWSEELLDRLAVDPAILPPVFESAAFAGSLLTEVAKQTGLKPGTPVIYGGGDQACQAIGNGVIQPGAVSCTIGTGGQLLAPILAPIYDPELRLHMFCHALPDRWYQMAAILAAGLSFKWLRDNVLEGQSYQNLADEAGRIAPGSEGLFFLPYLVGERTPHMDPVARAGFIGLTLRHRREHLVRAVMEGVVFALRQGLDLMQDLGVKVDRIIASGGGSAHPLWLQLQADIFNQPIYRTRTAEAAAAGAALLAGVGIGMYADAGTAVQETVHYDERIVFPNRERAGFYAEAFSAFCALYPALADFFHHEAGPAGAPW
jgi:xylulokinase